MVGIGEFNEVWDNIVEWLKDNSEKFGLTAGDIYNSHPLIGEPLPTPYVAVFALPLSEDDSIPDFGGIAGMLVTVFVAAEPTQELSQSVKDSVRLTNAVRRVIRSEFPGNIYRHSKPQPELMHNNAAIMSFELTTVCKE